MEAKPPNLDQLETEIRAIVQNNDKLINQIEELKKNKKILSKTFHELKVASPKFPNIREAYEFSCEDSVQEQSFEDLLISWRVPPGLDKLEDPDPDKLLYGENKDLMNVKCETYEDLQRINKQNSVALKYITLLRESASISFGKKFKKNFEHVQTLLKQILEIFEPKQGEDIIGNQIHGAVKDLNLQMMKLFQNDSVVNALPGKLSISSKILTKEMEEHLYLMLPRRIWKFKLIHDNSYDSLAGNFDKAVKGLSPTLIIIKSTTNYIFGAYVEDVWGSSANGWIKGSEQTFLFTFGSLNAIKPIKLNHNGIGNGIHITNCGLHLSSDLVAFCSRHSCTPSVYTKIAPGYPNVAVNNQLLAGAENWTPSFMEVFTEDK